MNNLTDTFEELRGHFDGSESFMNKGHQIIKLRKGNRTNPPWTKSDEKIREILLRSFPKMFSNPRQWQRAGRWLRVIHLYFRMNMTYGQVAAELSLKPRHVESLIRALHRAGKGRRSDGTGLLKAPKTPKK